jgi:hypothetical protein
VDDEVGAHDIIVDVVRNESEGIKSLRVRRQEQKDTVYDKIYMRRWILRDHANCEIIC